MYEISRTRFFVAGKLANCWINLFSNGKRKGACSSVREMELTGLIDREGGVCSEIRTSGIKQDNVSDNILELTTVISYTYASG